MTHGHEHRYEARLEWEDPLGAGTVDYPSYSRSYRISMEGKPDIAGTADRAFRGEAGKHNPEDLLVASLSACHMLSYLALCARRGIRVMRYSDDASGVMITTADGGGKFDSVTLRPRVAISDPSRAAKAAELHEKAHGLCFIANSCSFPVLHEAAIEIA